ncbi:hypothetical protein N7523_003766 [Penicillium sp. IBT 18751x]|nr:hypothetical protein N7523_003766 [Penicillium sp. IBT 18751x]
MPCDDEVWQSSHLNEKGDLVQAFIRSSASLIVMVSAYARERSLFQLLKPATMGGTRNNLDTGLDTMCALHSHQTTILAEQAMTNVAGKLQEQRLAPDETSSAFVIFSTMKKIYSISKILDHIPYTLLYVSSGWMSSETDTETSLADLTTRLRDDPRNSRRTLTYAAQLFRRVRNQKWLEACDPLYVLLATLYIWFYGSTFDISSEDPDSATWPPLKIDDESIDETVWQQWVDTGDKRRPHIGGIGFLNGKANGHRVLKEAIRILSNDQGWQHFAHAVAGSLQRILSGLAPSFEDI